VDEVDQTRAGLFINQGTALVFASWHDTSIRMCCTVQLQIVNLADFVGLLQ
jgi:hypothetical protein